MIKTLSIEHKEELEEIFKERVAFEFIDRVLYSHDMASIPSIIEKMIIKIPEAVVQPLNIEELQNLIKFAQDNKIYLTPRGAGTSGYGGAIPIQGGIVVDFTRMNKIVNLDKKNKIVTVEPGIIWKELETILNAEGLALETYPSSGLASTVGGWTAEGGTGFGGYEYGFFHKTIKSIIIITPSSEIKTLSGDEIFLAYELEGITGFIAQVALKLTESSPNKLIISAFPTFDTLIENIKDINKQNLPLWHIGYELPLYVKYRQKTHEKKFYPEDKFILICIYQENKKNFIEQSLQKIILANRGEILGDDTAAFHLASLFYPMRFKRLGPSFISGEIVISIDRLKEFIEKITNVMPDMTIHGSIVEKKEAIALGFALDDERNPEFTNHNKKSLEMIEMAEKLGGRPYNLGMYFHNKSHSLLGENRINEIKAFKIKNDPDDIFNPGKVILMKGEHDASTHLKTAIKASSILGNKISNFAGTMLSDKIKLKGEFPEKIFNEAFICAQCGFCRNDCTLFKAAYKEKYSPRGKWYLVKQLLKNNIKYDQEIADIFSICTTCGRCELHCQTEIPIFECFNIMKSYLIEKQIFNGFPALDFMTYANEATGNIWGISREARSSIMPLNKADLDILFWSGCTSFICQSEMQNIKKIFDKANFNFTSFGVEEDCCGILLLFWGHKESAEKSFRKNIEKINEKKIKKIITSCPSCYSAFKKYYPAFAQEHGLKWDIEIFHITEIIADLISNKKIKFNNPMPFNLTYHDPCHLGRHSKLYDAPRKVLQSLPEIKFKEMSSNREEALCCGNIIPQVYDSQISNKIINNLMSMISKKEIDILVTACDFCEMQFNSINDKNIKIRSLTSLVSDAIDNSYFSQDSSIPKKYLDAFNEIMKLINYDVIFEIIKENITIIFANIPISLKNAYNEVKKASFFSSMQAQARFEKIFAETIPLIIEKNLLKISNIFLLKVQANVKNIPDLISGSLPLIIQQSIQQILRRNKIKLIKEIRPILSEVINSLSIQ